MRKIIMLLSGLCLASLLFISCSKDDDNTIEINATKTSLNYLKIGNAEYDLSAGVFENYGIDKNNKSYHGYSTDLMLYSKDLSLQKNEKDFFMFAGKGHAIYFEMFSSSGKELNNGDYVFSSKAPFQIGAIDKGGLIQNLNFDYNRYYPIDPKDKSEITDGKISISKTGDEYSITINCVCENGIEINGYYQGTLPCIDWPLFDT